MLTSIWEMRIITSGSEAAADAFDEFLRRSHPLNRLCRGARRNEASSALCNSFVDELEQKIRRRSEKIPRLLVLISIWEKRLIRLGELW